MRVGIWCRFLNISDLLFCLVWIWKRGMDMKISEMGADSLMKFE
jgi:hypothetical protein